jgi:hypothetical protein
MHIFLLAAVTIVTLENAGKLNLDLCEGRRRKGKRRNSAPFRNTWSPDHDPPLRIDRLQGEHFIHALYVADYRGEICIVHGAVPIPEAARSKATATLEPETTRHNSLDRLLEIVWLHLIRHACPDF